ncbi:MAG: FAD-dependent thymidylate synthase [Bacteroidales bacterium]|nr:FAD-dependent thymidylate synthase [Bacteroidales bacterium]
MQIKERVLGLSLKISMIDSYGDPIRTMHAMAQNMRGNMLHRDELKNVPIEECIATLEEFDPKKTRLTGVLEFFWMAFQVETVPRAFTHQLVRHRQCGFSQESLRFTVKAGGDFKYDMGPSIPGTSDEAVLEYEAIMEMIQQGYAKLLDMGVKTEDARGVLPINTMTKIGFQIHFRELIKVCEVRDCYQSQAHWKRVMYMIKDEIKRNVPGGDYLVKWLIPACERSGRCEFTSLWDRACKKEALLRDKVCMNCGQRFKSKDPCGTWRNGDMCGAMERFMGPVRK